MKHKPNEQTFRTDSAEQLRPRNPEKVSRGKRPPLFGPSVLKSKGAIREVARMKIQFDKPRMV
ncbi:hypothetical protein [Effusibacillus pohliae]|uniref:hypothetical protein n=1 Tax=Effusibacillus pohliae TaxID=232270 RepID=UPI000368BC0F|nr:hypothetical protein [Effusibacillus pohliae]